MHACACFQVLGIASRHRECLLRYARLLLQAGQHEAALQLAQQAASFHPADYAAAKLHADALRSVQATAAPFRFLPLWWGFLHAVSACVRLHGAHMQSEL